MKNLDDLARYQDDFIAAAFRGVQPAPTLVAISAQSGFVVYRNTLLKGCVDNLAANFPTVLRLVGAQWFHGAALAYADGEPPPGVSLFDYGATFPAFLANLPSATELPYLANVARLDRMWIECHTAADAEPLSAAELSSLPPAALGVTCLSPHPSARWLTSADHPAGAIWIANREQQEFDAGEAWRGDSVLLTRIDNAVHWQLVDAGTAAFLDACALGAGLEEAAAHALSLQPGLDVAATLALLLNAGAFTTFTGNP